MRLPNVDYDCAMLSFYFRKLCHANLVSQVRHSSFKQEVGNSFICLGATPTRNRHVQSLLLFNQNVFNKLFVAHRQADGRNISNFMENNFRLQDQQRDVMNFPFSVVIFMNDRLVDFDVLNWWVVIVACVGEFIIVAIKGGRNCVFPKTNGKSTNENRCKLEQKSFKEVSNAQN